MATTVNAKQAIVWANLRVQRAICRNDLHKITGKRRLRKDLEFEIGVSSMEIRINCNFEFGRDISGRLISKVFLKFRNIYTRDNERTVLSAEHQKHQ